MVQEYVGKKAKIERLPDQPGDVPYTRADIRKAQRLVGYQPQVPFRLGIQKTVEWCKATYPEAFAGTKTATTTIVKSASPDHTAESNKSKDEDDDRNDDDTNPKLETPLGEEAVVDEDAHDDDDSHHTSSSYPTTLEAWWWPRGTDSSFFGMAYLQWIMLGSLVLCRLCLTSKCRTRGGSSSHK